MSTIVFHDVLDVPTEVVDFWRKTLMDADPAGYFTAGPEWFGLLASGNEAGCTVVWARFDDGKSAVLPLLHRKRRLRRPLIGGKLSGSQLSIFRVCGGDVINDGVSAADLAEIWGDLLGRYPDCDAVLIDAIPGVERMNTILESCRLSAGCFAFRERKQMPHYRLVLPGRFAEFCALRSSRAMREIRRHEKALAKETGEACVLVELRTVEELEKHGEMIESLMRNTWQARLLGYELDLGSAAQVASRGRLRSFLLLAGDVPLAFDMCYEGEGTLFREHSGYNQKYSKHYPGELLFYKTVEHLYATERPAVIDFGVGDAYYKRKFSNDVRLIDAVMVVRATAALKLGFAGYSGLRKIGELADSAVRMSGLKKLLVRVGKRRALR